MRKVTGWRKISKGNNKTGGRSRRAYLLSFIVGVNSPVFSVKSWGNNFHFCTIWALEVVFLLAAFMPSSRYLIHRGSTLASDRVVAVLPICGCGVGGNRG